MRFPGLFVLGAMLTSPVSVGAQVPDTRVQTAHRPVKGDPDRIICKTLPTLGSRLKPNRDCRTAQKWSDDQALDRRDIERLQMNRYTP
ncbi:hypothetical protein [Sphingomonas sp. PB4P5]|uniref:hypothetical protein n=1 Tax=Parasphingomonas puruogangriensis TaxID=3096155 RepID=UPI002FC7A51E